MQAGNAYYNSPDDLPGTIPVFPLTGAILLPGGQLPLNIFEPRYKEMIDDALSGERLIGMIQPDLKDKTSEDEPSRLSNVGCVGRLTAYQETGDGRYLIHLAGICRFEVREEVFVNTSYRQCSISAYDDDLNGKNARTEIDREKLIEAFRSYLDANGMQADWESIETTDDETLVNSLCMMSPYGPAEKQAMLEAPCLKTRAETLITISQMDLADTSSESSNRLQ